MLGGALLREWGARYDLAILPRAQNPRLPEGADLVLNAAAYSDVDGCERDPERAHASNALLARHLAVQCQKRKIPNIYVSTDYVFDGLKKNLYVEKDPVNPVNIYGMTKLEGEANTRAHAWVSAIVRTSWLFGPGNPRNFVNQIVGRLGNEAGVNVLDDQKDSPTYVKDLAVALEKVAQRLFKLAGRPLKGPVCETYHVCNRGVATRLEMASRIRRTMRVRDKFVKRADPGQVQGRLALRPAFASMSPALYEKTFKTTMRPWQEALAEYLKGPDS